MAGRPKHSGAGNRLASILAAEKEPFAAEKEPIAGPTLSKRGKARVLPKKTVEQGSSFGNSPRRSSEPDLHAQALLTQFSLAMLCCDRGDNGERQTSCNCCGRCAHISCLEIDLGKVSEFVCAECSQSEAAAATQTAALPSQGSSELPSCAQSHTSKDDSETPVLSPEKTVDSCLQDVSEPSQSGQL